MSNIRQMAAYAQAFEDAFDHDDWTAVGAFLTDDVVYEIGLPLLGADRVEGRTAVLEWFPDVLDRFDRRFEKRRLELVEGPIEEGEEIRIRGKAIYRADGVPDFHLELEEVLRFRGDRIAYIEDRYTPEMARALQTYLEEHGEALGVTWTAPVPESRKGSDG